MAQEEHNSRDVEELACWTQATFLSKRLPLPAAQASAMVTPEQVTKAESRLQKWHDTFGEDEALYGAWLADEALSEQELRALLVETPEMLYQRLPHYPAWLHTFASAFAHEPQPNDLSLISDLLAASPVLREQKEEQRDVRFLLTVVKPLLLQAAERLREEIRTYAQQFLDPNLDVDAVIHSLFSSLVVQLHQLLSRTLILEFRVAQYRGLFSGHESLADQLHAYACLLNQRDNAIAFFAEYPVLARQVTLCVEQWCETSREVLMHLGRDWTALQALFSWECDPGMLQELQAQSGDKHRGGRSVHILRFSSGFRLVYKPRSLAVDVHFQELLKWLNAHGQQPALRVLRILQREGHGWMEWVESFDCAYPEEIERFYLRQGANLALLYALEATDIHFENLLAAGEHPVLVDLESLLHAYIEPPTSMLSPAEQMAHADMNSSVLRTLLLPSRFSTDEEGGAWAEISGLGGAPGQVVHNNALHLSGFETGELHFIRDKAVLEGAKNRPHLQGKDVDLSTYQPQLLEGFAATYRLLLAHRQELLAEHGLIARFASHPTRVILRSTASYALLLRVCFHPYLLRDALDQERVMAMLWRTVRERPQMKALIASERADLQRGDIPFFTACGNSRALWTSTGKCLPDFFERSGFEVLQQRWHKLSEQDLERQCWFIRASFTTLVEGDKYTLQNVSERAPCEIEDQPLPSAVSHDELLEAACKVGDRLCQLATLEGERAAWVGLAQLAKGQWALSVAELNLYNGLTGIILALAYLGKLTGSEFYTRVARAGYASVHERIAQDKHEFRSVGFYSGWAGVIATLTHLGVLWQDEALLDEATTLVSKVSPLIDQDEGLDLVQGSAGCIAGLLCLAKVAPSAQINALLLRCGERLATSAISLPTGCGWSVFRNSDPLTGFAHGGAGFAWALLKLSHYLAVPRFQQLAVDALAYERSLYDPTYKNWRDMRGAREGQEDTYRVAWCYGAPGIGLARVDMLPLLPADTLLQAEIEAALETTQASGFGGNHSLCHGDLGNLELLLKASRTLPSKRWQAAYELMKASVFEHGCQHGWQCGTPQDVETPGLMIGLAGICLQLLRLAEPERVPSILTMDAPNL